MFTRLVARKPITPSLNASAEREAVCMTVSGTPMQMTRVHSAVHTGNLDIAVDTSTHAVERPRNARVLGLLIIATIPALFWTAMIALIAPYVGYSPTPSALFAIGLGLGAFLFLICSAFTDAER